MAIASSCVVFELKFNAKFLGVSQEMAKVNFPQWRQLLSGEKIWALSCCRLDAAMRAFGDGGRKQK